jgi:hypothetical protein
VDNSVFLINTCRKAEWVDDASIDGLARRCRTRRWLDRQNFVRRTVCDDRADARVIMAEE